MTLPGHSDTDRHLAENGEATAGLALAMLVGMSGPDVVRDAARILRMPHSGEFGGRAGELLLRLLEATE